MCTEGRRIESRSVCLKEPKQNYPKKITCNSFPTNLECKPCKIMAENNVCETIRQKIYAAFYEIKC